MKKLFILAVFNLITSVSLTFAASESGAIRDRINNFLAIPYEWRYAAQNYGPFLEFTRSLESPEHKKIAADTLSTVFPSNHHPVMQWLRFNNPKHLDIAVAGLLAQSASAHAQAASSVPVEPEHRAPDEPVTMRLFDEFDLGQPVNLQELAVLEGIEDTPVVAQPIVPAQAEPEAKFMRKVSRLESLAMRAFTKDLITKNPAALQTQEAFTKELLAKYIAPQSTVTASSPVEEPSQREVLSENPQAAQPQEPSSCGSSPIAAEKQHAYDGLYDRFVRLIPEVAREYYLSVKGDISKIPKWLKRHIREIGFSIQDLIDHEMIPENRFAGTRLNLSNMRINDLTGLENIPGIQNMTHLWLDVNRISTITPNAFTGLENLRVLNLSHNNLTTIAPNYFAGLPNLQELVLGDNHIGSIALDAFAGLANLQSLYLYRNNLTSVSPGIFTGLVNLQSIDFSNNPIKWIAPNSFIGLVTLWDVFLNGNEFINPHEHAHIEIELHTIAPNACIHW